MNNSVQTRRTGDLVWKVEIAKNLFGLVTHYNFLKDHYCFFTTNYCWSDKAQQPDGILDVERFEED